MHRSLVLAAGVLIASGDLAVAQTAPSRAVPGGRIDQKPIETSRPSRRRVKPVQAPPPATPAFRVAEIRIEGSTLSETVLRRTWAPFLGRVLQPGDLQAVTDAVAAAYETADVALYTVVVPNQDFAGGVLRLKAVEGHVAAVDLTDVPERWRAAPQRHVDALTGERPLARSTLERQVSLLRDIPGLKAEIDLQPGAEQGAVRMVVTADPAQVQLGLAVNNRGTAYLGKTQVQADLYLNSLLRAGDQTRLSVAAPTDGDFFRYYGLSHSQILDGHGTTVSLDATRLETRPRGTALEGEATALALQVAHPLIRSYDRNLYVTVGLDGLNSDNALLGAQISSDRVRAFRAGVAWSRQSETTLFAVSGSASRGIDGLGARHATPGYARADFTKLNARVSYNRALGERWVVRLAGAGQAALNPLPGSEQFALGGDEFGRAFESAYLTGDSGWAASVELAWRPPLPAVPLLGETEVYAYADAGGVRRRGRLGLPPASAEASSAGAGVRLAVARRSLLQLEAVRAIDEPASARPHDWRGVVTLRTLF